MIIPDVRHHVWAQVIRGERDGDLTCLAVKMHLGVARIHYKRDPSSLARLTMGLRDVFVKNVALPSVREDLNTLFG